MNFFASRLKESMNQQQMKPIDLLHLAEEQNLKLGKSHISQYVNGKTMPRAEILQFLANALQVEQTGWQDAPVLHRISVQEN
ncbi:MAG: helix-turn-helix domain-containing protein [Gallintestinimicrobium sp.]